MKEQHKPIIAIALSFAILVIYNYFFSNTSAQKATQAQAEQQVNLPAGAPPHATEGVSRHEDARIIPQLSHNEGMVGAKSPFNGKIAGKASDKTAKKTSESRININSAKIKGTLTTLGNRFDSLELKEYHSTVDPASSNIALFDHQIRPYYAELGWVSNTSNLDMPNNSTQWETNNDTLEPGKPVVLTWENAQGLTFTRTIEIDEEYMFTITDVVRNNSDKTCSIAHYGLIYKNGSESTNVGGETYLLHEGVIGYVKNTLEQIEYKDLRSKPVNINNVNSGWFGFTDKYFLSALIPDQNRTHAVKFRNNSRLGEDNYQIDYLSSPEELSPGEITARTTRLFAGPKVMKILDKYENDLNLTHFDLAIDFGWFYFLTKPIFHLLTIFNSLLGNFGYSILLLTVLMKLLFFPLANKSYRAMSRMKSLQPEMERLRKQYGDDRMGLNQAMIELYRQRKINPAAGCVPIIIQIPVFFALYKVLYVTIEMRHSPFIGWIHDLSAPDPTNLFNLFGLIPWTPPSYLALGVWPLLMGITMVLMQRLNPQPADPIQAKMFLVMQLVLMVVLAQCPAGLVIYWTWSNILSILQQYLIIKQESKSNRLYNYSENRSSNTGSKKLAKKLGHPNQPSKPGSFPHKK